MQRGATAGPPRVRALAFACPFGHTGFNPCWGARGEGGAHLLGLMAQHAPARRTACCSASTSACSCRATPSARTRRSSRAARRPRSPRAAGAAVSPLSLYDGGFVVKKPERGERRRRRRGRDLPARSRR